MSARSLQSALQSLVVTTPGYRALDAEPAIGPQPGGVSTGRPAGGSSGSIAFEESDYLMREYWDAVTVSTSDGLFTWEELPIKSIFLEGGDRALFAEPREPVGP